MTKLNQNMQDFPGWMKTLGILAITLITSTISVMAYTNKMKTDIAILQNEYNTLKESIREDITDIKNDINDARELIENLEREND
jgi:hypothetical protein